MYKGIIIKAFCKIILSKLVEDVKDGIYSVIPTILKELKTIKCIEAINGIKRTSSRVILYNDINAKYLSNYFKYLKNLTVLKLECNKATQVTGNSLNDDGALLLFNKIKYITNLQILNLNGNKRY